MNEKLMMHSSSSITRQPSQLNLARDNVVTTIKHYLMSNNKTTAFIYVKKTVSKTRETGVHYWCFISNDR
jgi:hypothetical protein